MTSSTPTQKVISKRRRLAVSQPIMRSDTASAHLLKTMSRTFHLPTGLTKTALERFGWHLLELAFRYEGGSPEAPIIER